MLPTPDCSGSRVLNPPMRPFCTSQLRNSRMWSAILLRRGVRRFERTIAVGQVGEHNGDNLLPGSTFRYGSSNALTRMDKGNGSAIEQWLQAVVDVVHAFQRQPAAMHSTSRMTRSAAVNPTSDCCRSATSLAAEGHFPDHRRDLDQRDIPACQETRTPHDLGDVAKVNVHVSSPISRH